MNDYSVQSFAKINLLLKILNKRPDNYHNIYSLFLELTKMNYDVWGIYRKGDKKNKSFQVDLLNINEIYCFQI